MEQPSALSPRFTGWVVGIAVAVMLALAPLLTVQYRQFRLLSENSDFRMDSVMWMAFQLEREHSRLAEAIEGPLARRTLLDPAALQLRYDIFLSRRTVLQESPTAAAVRSTDEYRQAMSVLDAFVQQAEPVFEGLANGRTGPAELSALRESMRSHETALGDLARRANQVVHLEIDARNKTIQQQGILVIVLAALQAVVLLVFVAMLILYIRKQYRQNTALYDLTQHLRTARAEAEAANQGKSVFLANMSHEIRTPFQGLLGMLNLLEETSMSGKQRDYVQTARDSAQHLLGILNDILDVSTLESGTLRLTRTPVRLEEVVADVKALMGVTAVDKGLTLSVVHAPGLPEWVLADATRLRQILFNLISNAIKFTGQGGITVTVRQLPGHAPGVEFAITDTGMGMDAKAVKHLFERFYQVDSSVRRRFGGTGLGLEISRTLARMMGGDITVSSEVGVGSTFVLALPLEAAAAPAPAPLAQLAGGRPLRVLAAEDHPINLKYLGILLEKMGHDAAFCENGLEAVQLVSSQPFDVVLMDLHMPEMDGLSATRAIRALDGPGAAVKIVLVTADVVNDTREQALRAGVDAFAAKPLQANDLRRAFRHCGLLPAESGEPEAVGSNQFSVSDYDVPIELPPAAGTTGDAVQPLQYLDGPSFREVVAMMPEDTLRDLLHELFDEPRGSIQSLLEALDNGDRHHIGLVAHQLKGTAMLLGLKAIVKMAADLEHTARKTSDRISPRASGQLRVDVANTRQAIEALGVAIGRPAISRPEAS